MSSKLRYNFYFSAFNDLGSYLSCPIFPRTRRTWIMPKTETASTSHTHANTRIGAGECKLFRISVSFVNCFSCYFGPWKWFTIQQKSWAVLEKTQCMGWDCRLPRQRVNINTKILLSSDFVLISSRTPQERQLKENDLCRTNSGLWRLVLRLRWKSRNRLEENRKVTDWKIMVFEICYRSAYIVRLDIASKKWHKMGLLKQARFGHGVIHHAGSFVVIGGDDISMATEVCNFKVKFSFLIVRK